MPETPAYLEVDNLSKVYASEDGPIRALDKVSLKQQRGEFVSIVGPSGCGKSTLLMIAAGLASSSEGRVLVESKVVNAARTDLGMVFQSHVLLEWRTALENQALPDSLRRRFPEPY